MSALRASIVLSALALAACDEILGLHDLPPLDAAIDSNPIELIIVRLSGSGRGTVISSPAGINCTSSECIAAFAAGTSVTLTAAAATGSSFTGWNGGGCAGTGPCTTRAAAGGGLGVTAVFVAVN